MEIKYSAKKQEMRHDPVMEGIVNARKYVTENSNTLLSVVIVILLVISGFAAYTHVKRSGEKRASEAFGKAMIAYTEQRTGDAVEGLSLVADKHRSAPQAAYAAFMLGHLYLGQGNYDEAITWFDVAAGHKNAGFVAGEALEGLAACFEAKENYEQALDYLQKALKVKTISYRYPAIRWKSALICRSLGRNDEARRWCEDMLSDSLATQYRQKVENLLAEIKVL